jgi:peptide/nickel transport system substrate-binding protein
MQQKWKLRRVAASGALALGLVLSFAATGSAATSPHGKIQNKTISFAEGPSANPNYIFPFVNCNYFSVDNLNQFQELMYRPAYWFGLGSSPAEVPTLSLYKAPAWNTASTSVTLTAQTWAKWSDGQACAERQHWRRVLRLQPWIRRP